MICKKKIAMLSLLFDIKTPINSNYSANINFKDYYGGDLLYYAAANRNIEDVIFLLKNGVDTDASKSDGFAIGLKAPNRTLDLAILQKTYDPKDLEIVKLLITKGSNPIQQDPYGVTALHKAAYSGKVEILKFLVSITSSEKLNDIFNKTIITAAPPLWYALMGAGDKVRNRFLTTEAISVEQQDYINTVEFLLSHGTKVYLKDMVELLGCAISNRSSRLQNFYFNIVVTKFH